MKKSSLCFIFAIILIGGFVPFAAQFLFPAIFKSYNPAGAEVWNQYVSIILGIVATVVSIISLYLCLRSEERSNESDKELKATFNSFNKEIIKLSITQEHLGKQIDHVFNNASIEFSDSKKVSMNTKLTDKKENRDI